MGLIKIKQMENNWMNEIDGIVLKKKAWTQYVEQSFMSWKIWKYETKRIFFNHVKISPYYNTAGPDFFLQSENWKTYYQSLISDI